MKPESADDGWSSFLKSFGSDHLTFRKIRLPIGANKIRCVLPGSFNPIHAGHLAMAAVAQLRLKQPVWFEISLNNVDKVSLSESALQRRLNQNFASRGLLISNATTFVEKSRLFPGCTFLVGADTIRRVAQVDYYLNESAMADAIAEIAKNGCQFLVFGRLDDNKFRKLENLELGDELFRLCEAVDEQIFRFDLSSREIRDNK